MENANNHKLTDLFGEVISLFVQLLTPWHKTAPGQALLEYDGNTHTVFPSNKLRYVRCDCPHFAGLGSVGDPFWRSPE